MQQKLYIDDFEVEMGSEVSGFQFVSAVEGLDKRHASRSETIKIPMTPHNMRVFGFPNHADQWGGAVRTTHQARLNYAGGVVSGTFKVTSVTPGTVSGTLIYGGGTSLVTGGELSQKLSEVITPPDYIVLRAGKWYWQNSQLLGTQLYFNGYNNDAAVGFKLPSVRVDYLVGLLETALGFTATADLKRNDLRIILNTMNAEPNVTFTGTAKPNALAPFTLSSGLSTYLTNGIIVTQASDGSQTSPDYVLIAQQQCLVKINGTSAGAGRWRKLPASAAGRVRNYDWLRNNFEDVVDRAYINHTFEMHVGDMLCFWSAYYGPNYSSWATAGDNTFNVDVAQKAGPLELGQDGSGWNYGNYYLSANLPDMSVGDLLRALAVAQGGELMYDENTKTFDIFDWDFDSAADSIVSLDGVCEVTSIDRRAMDYGQVHKVGLEPIDETNWSHYSATEREQSYMVPNQTLDAETSVVAPVLKATAGTGDGYTFMSAVVKCGWVDNQGHPTCSPISAPVLCEVYTNYPKDGTTAGRLRPMNVPRNAVFESILKLSTVVEVEVPMRLFQFMQIRTTTRFTLLGGWWFCRTANFQGGKAKLKLQRYK